MGSLEVGIKSNRRTTNKLSKATRTLAKKESMYFCGLLLFVSVGMQAYLLSGFQTKNSLTAGYLTILLSQVSIITAIVIVLFALKTTTSVNLIAEELRGIRESNDFSNRLDPDKYHLNINLAEELNKLLVQVEHKNKKVEEISEVIDHQEQENQLLWLEIEHNLCLAKEEAEIDGLTQICNRKSIEKRLSKELDKAIKINTPLSVLMADIDYFKQVNDTYGHKVGDEVLGLFANILKESVRSGDIPARYGGEEFLVVLPDTPAAAALKIAKRVNTTFKELIDKNLNPVYEGLRCTVSIGVADFPTAAIEKNALIAAADMALYKAKDDGRNRVVYNSGNIRGKKESEI